jgi:hypothetical protein
MGCIVNVFDGYTQADSTPVGINRPLHERIDGFGCKTQGELAVIYAGSM